MIKIFLLISSVLLFGFAFADDSTEDKLKKYIHYNDQGPNNVGYIYVGDHETAISDATWLYIKQALDDYKKTKPIFIILDLNTPGGEVFAAQKISDALKEIDIQNDIPVVALIDNWAISAGAMLAYSCRFIATVKDGSMGAAEPVLAGETGKMESASEKVNSAIRADFASRAGFFDRDPLIAEGMVDKDLIIIRRNGKFIKLENENQIQPVDTVVSPKGKLLTLEAEKMKEYGVADLILPPKKLAPITEEEKTAGKWPAKKNLLFQNSFFAKIPQATIDEYKMDWKTSFFVFLASPLVSSLLMMGLIIGAYIEFNNPGMSLPGSIAAICLFMIVLSSFSLQIANWLELILLLTGLILIIVELFFLPSFGLLGFVGIILFLFGLFGMLIPGVGNVSFEYDTKTLNAAGEHFIYRLAWLSGSLILSALIIVYLAIYVLPGFKGFNRFVLAGKEQDASEGYVSGTPVALLPKVGSTGTALTTLRPAGKILVDEQVFDAVSTGGFIEALEPIVVARLDGNVVRVSKQV